MNTRPRTISPRSALDVATSVILIAAAAVLIYRNVLVDSEANRNTLRVPSEPISIDAAPIRGSEDAAVVMIVYSDFQCPYCGRFTRDVLPEIERRYIATGDVALAFRHLPLPIHRHAPQAAALAECAAEQGLFWEMHDLLFAQTGLNDDALDILASAPDFDTHSLDRCLRSGSVVGQIQASIDQAEDLGVNSTPSFFFGRRLDDGRVRVFRALSGARPAEDFIRDLDATLGDESGRSLSWLRRLLS